MPDLRESALTGAIIKAFFRVYDALGFGLLESIYAFAFARELQKLGVPFEREAMIDA